MAECLRCPKCGSIDGPGCNCRGDKHRNFIEHDGFVRTNINFGLNAKTVGYNEYKWQKDKLESKVFEPQKYDLKLNDQFKKKAFDPLNLDTKKPW